MFQLAKMALLLGFFVSHRLFCLRAPQIIRQTQRLNFKTTIIEDTNLTLAGILFKVEANNCMLLQAYEKKFAEFLVLLRYTISCLLLLFD